MQDEQNETNATRERTTKSRSRGAVAEATASTAKAQANAVPPSEGVPHASAEVIGVRAPATPEQTAAETYPKSIVDKANLSEQNLAESDLTPQSIVEAVIGVNSLEIDSEAILVDLLTDQYIRLNSTATFIWRLILQRCTVEEIGKQLSREYRLSNDKGYEVASDFIRKLVRRGLATFSARAQL